MQHPLFEKHRATLDRALEAIATRGYWTPYPESPSPRNYGEGAAAAGKAAFDALANQRFPLTQPGTTGQVGAERSPYGIKLGITYPKADVDALMAAIESAEASWRKAGPEAWVGVSLEILDRINKASFEIANAVMHTTGQAFVMAFQAGGPHAQDRGLEAVAYAWDQMRRVPGQAMWEKPQGKGDPVRMEKQFRVVPRGVALVIGCSTFPTWNGYPAIFASLATGNAVIVKPHPNAILPLAITVRIAREVLRDAGFDPNVVTLVAHDAGDDTAQGLALRPEVKIVDFTGSTANGRWLEEHARQAQVYTEKAGVNQVIVDSTGDLKGLVRNLAFSLALYTGQMCTAPQNIYVPKTGIETDVGHLSFDDFAAALADGVRKLLGDDARATEVLGAVVNDGVLRRIEAARALGDIALDTRAVTHPEFADATIRTPLIVKLGRGDRATYLNEWFGPIAFVIATDDTDDSLAIARDAVAGHGALTMAVYSTSEDVIRRAIDVAEDVGVALSINLTGGIFVNQSAAFSDFHGTGANPAANAALTDAAYVANRFRIVQHRRHI
ncbi:MAG TPA: phenylacetic acid degradation protein PaaN [Casimicrobiaceae bacterium]|nr:phenylacetic acid degradation protein PaaN [Casimicrobiaceae bacterium]HWD16974.1 phenylacetic acid degradation protein PaaN [Casimicrobiaceae bacterium]